MAQTPAQRRANEAYARAESNKRGKPQAALKQQQKQQSQKIPISKGWLFALLFVVCGGLVFELLRIVFGFGGA